MIVLSNFVPFLILIMFNVKTSSSSSSFNISLSSDDQEIRLLLSQNAKNTSFTISNPDHLFLNGTLFFHSDPKGIIQELPSSIDISDSNSSQIQFYLRLEPKSAGFTVLTTNSTNENLDTSQAFIRIRVMHFDALNTISIIVGWGYFVAWSISFYPQIYENWKRKSVVGLNFDFLTLNIIGFTLYGLFNVGLLWIPEIQKDYFKLHPTGVNPVKLNDVIFALHAALACLITIVQCFMFERGTQRVSRVCYLIVGGIAVTILISLILSFVSTISWLTFLYICSYVKLFITLIKYVPQAFMNFRRKSTFGWSIGNVLLDFTGGSLSILQMVIDSYNNNDWASIFGDPTKFGLGLFSVLFDCLFMFQHYYLYRNRQPHEELIDNDIQQDLDPEEQQDNDEEILARS